MLRIAALLAKLCTIYIVVGLKFYCHLLLEGVEGFDLDHRRGGPDAVTRRPPAGRSSELKSQLPYAVENFFLPPPPYLTNHKNYVIDNPQKSPILCPNVQRRNKIC